MAERNGSALRRRLRSAERLSDAAMARGLRSLNTPSSRSRASLVSFTRRDHFSGMPGTMRPAARAARSAPHAVDGVPARAGVDDGELDAPEAQAVAELDRE